MVFNFKILFFTLISCCYLNTVFEFSDNEENLKSRILALQNSLEIQKGHNKTEKDALQKSNHELSDIKKQNDDLIKERIEIYRKLAANDDSNKLQNVPIPNKNNQITTWIKRIARAETEAVLNELLEYCYQRKNKEQLQDIVQISSRFKNMKNKINRGILNEDDSLLETGRINNSIISFLLDLQENTMENQ